MHKQNPIDKALHKKMQKLDIQKQRDTYGIIEEVDYEKGTCTVYWRETRSYAEKISYNVPISEEKNSIFSGQLQRGDVIVLGFKNNSIIEPYVLKIHKKIVSKNYTSRNGSNIPKYYTR